MKQLIYILVIAFILPSCMFYRGVYTIGLKEVEKPEDAKIRYGTSEIVNFEEEGSTKYSYEDSMIRIVWVALSTQFSFSLQNKTSHSIKIIWDEAVYVDQHGTSKRVMHSGVKYIDRNSPQPPTVIIKNGRIDDIVVPTDNVYYVSGEYGGWRTYPLFPNSATSPEELKKLSEAYIGKEVKVLLPLMIQETVNEYIFTFKVENFTTK